MFRLGIALKSKLSRLLTAGNRAALIPTLDHPALAVDELQLHEAGEKADVVQAFGRALTGQLLIFPQEGRQLERLEVVGEQDLGGVGHAASPETRHM